MAALACAATIGLAGCSQDVPFVAGSPAASFGAAGCTASFGEIQDVTASPPHGDRLLEAHPLPQHALVCEYTSRFGRGVGPNHTLAKQLDVSERGAARLATAVARIDVGIPAGTTSCSDDTGSVTVIVFSYPKRPATDLWWHSSGCQSIDDGTVGAAEVANESFFRFQAVFAAVTRDPAEVSVG